MNSEEIATVLNEPPTSIEFWKEAIFEWEKDADEEDYIILCDGSCIGWLGVNGLLSKDKTAYIKMLALLPDYQGKGIGAKALDLIINDLKNLGYVKVILYTNQRNIKAQKCYEKCGFQITKTFMEKRSNGEYEHRLKMELLL